VIISIQKLRRARKGLTSSERQNNFEGYIYKESHLLVDGEAILARKSLLSRNEEVGGPVFIAVRCIATFGGWDSL
jgi:hypothetical protein